MERSGCSCCQQNKEKIICKISNSLCYNSFETTSNNQYHINLTVSELFLIIPCFNPNSPASLLRNINDLCCSLCSQQGHMFALRVKQHLANIALCTVIAKLTGHMERRLGWGSCVSTTKLWACMRVCVDLELCLKRNGPAGLLNIIFTSTHWSQQSLVIVPFVRGIPSCIPQHFCLEINFEILHCHCHNCCIFVYYLDFGTCIFQHKPVISEAIHFVVLFIVPLMSSTCT